MAEGVAVGGDAGTSGVRAALVDAAGAAVAFGAAPLEPGRRADPGAWWAAAEAALDALRRRAGLAAVRAVAVDGTSGTLLAVDASGRPLAPARMYNEPAAPGARRAVEGAAPAESAARGPASPLAKALGLPPGAVVAAGYRRLAEAGAPPLRSVRSAGGGARNAAWTVVRTRVFGVPLVPAASEEAAVGAAAALALRALGPRTATEPA